MLGRDGGLLRRTAWGKARGDKEHQAEEHGFLQLGLEEAESSLFFLKKSW